MHLLTDGNSGPVLVYMFFVTQQHSPNLLVHVLVQLWDARQTCCAAVHSFPRFPDLLAISSCVVMTDDSCGMDGQLCDKAFRTHKLEMKRSPRYTHRLLADSSSSLQHSAHG